jgi:RHS repeat-associated protein
MGAVAQGTGIGTGTVGQALTSQDGSNFGSVIYSFQSQASFANGGSCSSTGSTTVSVKPVPTINSISTSPASNVICSGAQTSLSLNTNGVSGTTYTWTVTPAGNVSGSSTPGSVTSTTQTLSNVSATTGSVSYSIVPAANGCQGGTASVSVAVNPNPSISLNNVAPTLCSGGSTNIGFSSAVAGTTFTWTASPSNLTGASAQGTAVSAGTIAQALSSQDGVNAGSAQYNLSSSATFANGGTCYANASASVNVNAKPTATPLSKTFFVGNAVSVSLASNIAGSTYSYSVSSAPNITGASSGSGPSIAQALTITDNINPGTVTYSVTPTANGCVGIAANTVISIYPQPTITSTATSVYMGSKATLSAQSFYDSYNWSRTLGTVSGGSSIVTGIPDTYALTVVKNGVTSSVPAMFSLANQFSGQNLNYIITNSLQVATADSSRIRLMPVDSVLQSVQYFDGLGRAIQNVATQASPLKNDIVQAVAYDAFGRQSKNYLPYTSSGIGSSNGLYKTDPLGIIAQSYTTSLQYTAYNNGSADKIIDDTRPFGETMYESSALNRPLQAFGPGQNWKDNNAAVNMAYKVNPDPTTAGLEKIIAWTINAKGMPRRDTTVNGDPSVNKTLPGYYPWGKLSIKSTKDEQGNEVRVYMDKLGRTILKKGQAVANPTDINGASNYACTYYIYDDFGLLRYIFQPELTKALIISGGNPTSADLAKFAFQYKYDGRNRMVTKRVPGADSVFMIYDNRDRLVMTQDANQRTSSQWIFIKYDLLNRPVLTGAYTSANTRKQMQKAVNDYYTANNGAQFWGEARGTVVHNYTNNSYPQVSDSTQYLTVTYYDNYLKNSSGSANYFGWGGGYAYVNDGLATGTYSQPALALANTLGLTTGTKTKVLNSTTWLKKIVYYDYRQRPLQSIVSNNKGGTDRSSILYDLIGKALQVKRYHNGGGSNVVTVVRKVIYDHATRVTQIYQKINSVPTDQLVAQFNYNELGQVVEKNLHNTGGSNYLQSVDLRYNIRGWLNSINNAQLTADGVMNDDTGDYFGLELFYNNSETSSLGNTPYYNGNISAIKWKNAGVALGVADQRSYKYKYDNLNRLATARFQANTGSTWTKETNTLNENLSYDLNGNILTLARYQNLRGLAIVNSLPAITSAQQAIDSLSYTYTNAGNQLNKVSDAATVSAGFMDGANVASEYQYNSNGSLTSDQNKGISSIAYNILSKPISIAFADGRTISYVYDATGSKLSMTTTVSGVTTVTEYVSGYVYTNNALSFFSTPEGRVVNNTSGSLEYQYSITDHLGNTRVLFTSAPQTPIPSLADFDGDANDRASQFQNVNTVVPYTAANHTPGGSKVVRLNQATPVGPGKSIKVFPGDKVDMEVWSYYEATGGYGTGNTPIAGLITAVTGALLNGGPDAGGLKSNGVTSALNVFGVGANQGDTQPAAFLNYILFDANYKVLDAGWKVAPAGSFTKQYVNLPTVTVKEAGYIFVYLSYEDQSNNYIYFDDFKVTLTPTNILQSNEYYPFGQQTASSWTRDNVTPNNFLANGGTELNNISYLYDLDFRNYDPLLGRMNQIDPKVDEYHSFSPYNYSFNSPVLLNDPNGADPTIEIEIGKYVFSFNMNELTGAGFSVSFENGSITSVSQIENATGDGKTLLVSGFEVYNHSHDPDAIVQGGWANTIDNYKKSMVEPWVGQAMVTNEYSPGEATLEDGLLMVSLVGGDLISDLFSVGVDISNGNYRGAALSAASVIIPFVSATVLKYVAKKLLPVLDATGKVHGLLPKPKDFDNYSKEELQILLDELKQSVQKRIDVTSKIGRDRAHGQRQGAEQDLIKSLEKYLSE